MKLIDLLVKKTNEQVWGWPGKSTFCYQTKPEHGYITKFFDRNGVKVVDYCWEKCDDASVFNELTKEQYETALAASDGWIEWGGGRGMPVSHSDVVDLRFRELDCETGVCAGSYYWPHTLSSADITAYRLHKPDINSRANDDRLEQDLNECIGQDVDMPEWSEGGLPPVGIKCEFTHEPYSVEAGELTGIIPKVGGVVEVVAHRLTSDNNPVAVVYWDDNGAGRSACFVEECFRPLRTEAEKEREAAIQDLTSVICGNVPDTGMATAAMYAKRVYDSGYRKESK